MNRICGVPVASFKKDIISYYIFVYIYSYEMNIKSNCSISQLTMFWKERIHGFNEFEDNM